MEVVLTLDTVDPYALAPFWEEALGYRRGHAGVTYVGLVPLAEGSGPKLLLQRVPETKQTKNRMHLDLHVADVDAEVARLVALGATDLGRVDEDGDWWHVLADPEGNELCIVPART